MAGASDSATYSLRGKRGALFDEASTTAWSLTKLSKVVGNTVGLTLKARPPYGAREVEFPVFVRLVVTANVLPAIDGDGAQGLTRRIRALRVGGALEPDPDRAEAAIRAIRAEFPGLTAWAVEGLQKLVDHHYRIPWPAWTREALTDDRASNSPIHDWVLDRVDLVQGREGEGCRFASRRAHQDYLGWFANRQRLGEVSLVERPLTEKEFGRACRSYPGLARQLIGGRSFYRGARLRADHPSTGEAGVGAVGDPLVASEHEVIDFPLATGPAVEVDDAGPVPGPMVEGDGADMGGPDPATVPSDLSDEEVQRLFGPDAPGDTRRRAA